MTDIPSAEEIRNLPTKSKFSEEQLEKWRIFIASAITAFILENAKSLNEGNSIFFEPPAVRDMGESINIWAFFYEDYIKILQEKGYWCRRSERDLEITLQIALKNPALIDPPRLRRNAGT